MDISGEVVSNTLRVSEVALKAMAEFLKWFSDKERFFWKPFNYLSEKAITAAKNMYEAQKIKSFVGAYTYEAMLRKEPNLVKLTDITGISDKDFQSLTDYAKAVGFPFAYTVEGDGVSGVKYDIYARPQDLQKLADALKNVQYDRQFKDYDIRISDNMRNINTLNHLLDNSDEVVRAERAVLQREYTLISDWNNYLSENGAERTLEELEKTESALKGELHKAIQSGGERTAIERDLATFSFVKANLHRANILNERTDFINKVLYLTNKDTLDRDTLVSMRDNLKKENQQLSAERNGIEAAQAADFNSRAAQEFTEKAITAESMADFEEALDASSCNFESAWGNALSNASLNNEVIIADAENPQNYIVVTGSNAQYTHRISEGKDKDGKEIYKKDENGNVVLKTDNYVRYDIEVFKDGVKQERDNEYGNSELGRTKDFRVINYKEKWNDVVRDNQTEYAEWRKANPKGKFEYSKQFYADLKLEAKEKGGFSDRVLQLTDMEALKALQERRTKLLEQQNIKTVSAEQMFAKYEAREHKAEILDDLRKKGFDEKQLAFVAKRIDEGKDISKLTEIGENGKPKLPNVESMEAVANIASAYDVESTIAVETSIESYQDMDGIISRLDAQLADHNVKQEIVNGQAQLISLKTDTPVTAPQKPLADEEMQSYLQCVMTTKQIAAAQRMKELQEEYKQLKGDEAAVEHNSIKLAVLSAEYVECAKEIDEWENAKGVACTMAVANELNADVDEEAIIEAVIEREDINRVMEEAEIADSDAFADYEKQAYNTTLAMPVNSQLSGISKEAPSFDMNDSLMK